MKFENMGISKKLTLGFTVILLFVLLVGGVAARHIDQIYQQVELMYNHPLQVRRAIDYINNDVLIMRVSMRDILLTSDDQGVQDALQQIALASTDAGKQLAIIQAQYLGDKTDVDQVYQDYTIWKISFDKNIELALAGEIEEVKQSLSSNGDLGTYRQTFADSLNELDVFAQDKASALYQNAIELNQTLKQQLAILLAAILLISIFVTLSLIRSVRNPLKAMNSAVLRFHHGDMEARSSYVSKNEFGLLSASINTLAERVQKTTGLNEMTLKFTQELLVEDDDRKFFQSILLSLCEQCGAHIAAVYLRNGITHSFELFESIGMDSNAKKSFSADSADGEFGAAILSHRIQYLANIPEDTRFVFSTANGSYIPRGIIVIPIVSNNRVIAIISLATLKQFEAHTMDFINRIHYAITARIDGILAYQAVTEYRDVLLQQNYELETQKNELCAQAVELTQQKTELEMQKRRLTEASQLKTNFLSNMSHELRTPLNSVIALSGLLSRKLANLIPEEEYSYLEIIERNGKNLLMSINDVLNISRIEAGYEEVEITRFNVNDSINELVLMLEPLAKQKNVELIHHSSDLVMLLDSDADKFRHILQNLIGNALKFTEKGSVTITAQNKENSIEISVADTGIGIAPEHMPHIFEEFRQADGGTSRRFGGSGLGLAIAKGYADLLGGSISVQSTLDVGTLFTLTLPICYSAETELEKRELDETDLYANKHSRASEGSLDKIILVVEDNESAIIQIRDLVGDMGYRVQIAHDAGEAFAAIDQQIPDAMILDLMMPDVNGFKVLELLRNAEVTAHIPVLILTAKHITKDELTFLKRNNVHQLIQKGDVDRKSLQNAVHSMVYPVLKDMKKAQHKKQIVEGRPVVLVVEDNPDNMITVKALLADNYTLIEAVNGHEGIEMAKEHIPNLILMDIALPDISGIDAYIEIKKMPKLQHIPIIALTASAMEHDREAILGYGFDAFVAKPIIAKQLYDVLKEVLYD